MSASAVAAAAAATTQSKEQQLEAALRQFVRNALQGVVGPVQNSRNFHTMLSQMEKLDHRDPARARWYRALADCTSLIAAAPSSGLISHLMDPIWDFPVELAPTDTVKAFCGLTQNLVTTNLRFAEPCLRFWVSQIIQSCSMLHGGAVAKSDDSSESGIGEEPAASPDPEQMQELAHSMLQQLVRLTPQTTTLLLRVLVFEFPPHASSPAATLLVYMKNLLRVSEYCPSLRDSILTTITERLLRMDLEITALPVTQQEEDEKNHAVADDLFILEEVDSASSTSSNCSESSSSFTVAQKPPHSELADKLDSLLSLMFEYLNLARKCDPELCDQVFASLLRTFGRSILKTHGSHFTQYLLFVSCGFEHKYAASFARSLLNVVLDGTAEPGLRVAAAAYLSGFLCHAHCLRIGLITEIFDRMVAWVHVARPHILQQMVLRQAAQGGQSIQANQQRSLAALSSPSAGNGRRSPDRRPFPNAVFGQQQNGAPPHQHNRRQGGLAGVAAQECQAQNQNRSSNSGTGDLYNERVYRALVQAIIHVLCQRLPELLRHYGADAGETLAPEFARFGRGQNRNDSLGMDESDSEDSSRLAAPIWTGSPALGATQNYLAPPSFSLGSGHSPQLLPSADTHVRLSGTPDLGEAEGQQVYLRTQVEELLLKQCRLHTLLRDEPLHLLDRFCQRTRRQLTGVLQNVGMTHAVLPVQHQDWAPEPVGACSCTKAGMTAAEGGCWFPFDPFRLPNSRRYIGQMYFPTQLPDYIRVVDPQRPNIHHHRHLQQQHDQQPHQHGMMSVRGAVPIMPRPGVTRSMPPPRPINHRLPLAPDDDGESSDADNESDDGGGGGEMAMAFSLYD